MKGDRLGKILLGGVALGGLLVPSAQAVDPDMVLEEVVVTAQKREQGANDVGMTLNAFNSTKLEVAGVKSAEDMGNITPGLSISATAATGVPNYTIRGVGFSDYTTSASSTVGLYFDEVAIPYAVMSRGVLFDVERVEVLKGPQGDLYGRNTTAGQINFVSKKPTDEFEAGIKVGYGRFNVFDGEGYVSGPISDSMQGRFAFKTTQSRSGWQKSITRDDELGEQNNIAMRGSLNWDASDDFKALLSVHYIKDKSDNIAPAGVDGLILGYGSSVTSTQLNGLMPPFVDGDNRASDWSIGELRPRRDNELFGANLRMDWAVGEVDITSITGYDKFTRSEANDWDGSSYRFSNNINDTDLEVFSQELRASGTKGDVFWVTGVYYSWDQMDEDYNYFMNESYFASALGILTLDTRYSQKTTSAAAFAHAEWDVTDRLQLVGGLRYTEEDRTWSGCTYDRDGSLMGAMNNIIRPYLILPRNLPDPGLVEAGGCTVYNDIEGSEGYGTYGVFTDTIETNKLMWKVGANYDLTDDILAYATISSGFKSGGFNGANANAHSQLVPYGPEKILSYEAGLKSTLLEGRMQLNLSGFYYDYKDKQERMPAITFVGAISGLTNVPKSRIYGAEAELNWLVAEDLMVDLGVAYVDTKVVDWTAVDGLQSSFGNVVYYDASGGPLTNAPTWSLNGSISKGFKVGNGLMLTAIADGNYKGSSIREGNYGDNANARFLANARLMLDGEDKPWAVSLWMRNAFNKYYYTATLGSNGTYSRIPGMPRTYGIDLSYKF